MARTATAAILALCAGILIGMLIQKTTSSPSMEETCELHAKTWRVSCLRQTRFFKGYVNEADVKQCEESTRLFVDTCLDELQESRDVE